MVFVLAVPAMAQEQAAPADQEAATALIIGISALGGGMVIIGAGFGIDRREHGPSAGGGRKYPDGDDYRGSPH